MAHYALVTLLSQGFIHHVVSQNVDGLHLRSGMAPKDLTELHGNIFLEICTACKKEYFRSKDVGGMGLQLTGNICDGGDDVLLHDVGIRTRQEDSETVVDLTEAAIQIDSNNSKCSSEITYVKTDEDKKLDEENVKQRKEKRIIGCGGLLRDDAVDWDTPLPEDKFRKAEEEIEKADLVITLGTSLRIRPAGQMPAAVLKKRKDDFDIFSTKKRRRKGDSNKGKLVIVNLQKTHLDEKASLVIHSRCDDVLTGLCEQLGIWIDDNPTLPPPAFPFLLSRSCRKRNKSKSNEEEEEGDDEEVEEDSESSESNSIALLDGDGDSCNKLANKANHNTRFPRQAQKAFSSKDYYYYY